MKIENYFPKYHKIKSIYKRNMDSPRKEFREGEFSCPEFEYLKDNEWEFTEKVDGTNVRVLWDGEDFRFGGRTDKAQMPVMLLDALKAGFHKSYFESAFPEGAQVMLYGEGYGFNIQSGSKYMPGTRNPCFVLFDIRIGNFWLKRCAIEELAHELHLFVVPMVFTSGIKGYGTLQDAVKLAKEGFGSAWGDFEAEGIIAKPRAGIIARNGSRIITKVKCKDFI